MIRATVLATLLLTAAGQFGGNPWGSVFDAPLDRQGATRRASTYDDDYAPTTRSTKKRSRNAELDDEEDIFGLGLGATKKKDGLDHRWDHCDKEESFFVESVALRLKTHPDFDGTGAKLALSKKGQQFYAVNQPFSSEANRISMSLKEKVQKPEDELAKQKRLIREKRAWNAARIAGVPDIVEEKVEEKETSGSTNDGVEVWYVNMDTHPERKECLEKQFQDMKPPVKANRFPALKFPTEKECGDKPFVTCLQAKGFGDCVEGGVDWYATSTHGSGDADEFQTRAAVISNWCGHKRLWKQLEKSNSSKYHVVLEDDTILDREWFMNVVSDFATNYKDKEWDLVQVDPFGAKDKKDLVGHFRGKPVFQNTEMGGCSMYWGFHAALIKNDALPRINKWMATHDAIPIDWIQWKMPRGLSFSGLIARNPEAKLYGKTIALPSYCSKAVERTTIG